MDALHDPFDVAQHLVVPEAQHAITLLLQIVRSLHVVFDVIGLAVLTTIQFDHDAQLVAGEVRKVWTNGGLPAKKSVIYSETSQVLPEFSLGICHVSPQLAGACNARIRFSRQLVYGHAAAPTPDPSPPRFAPGEGSSSSLQYKHYPQPIIQV